MRSSVDFIGRKEVFAIYSTDERDDMGRRMSQRRLTDRHGFIQPDASG